MALAANSDRKKRVRAQTEDSPRKQSKHKGFLSDTFAKGIKKVKRNYMEKVMSFEPTAETPEMAEALQQFELIKQRMEVLSDSTITKWYDANIGLTHQKLHLSEKLMSLQPNDEDIFRTFADNVVGRKLFKINHMTNEYLVKMEKELINPLSIYKSKEISKAAKLLTTYKELKDEYDYAHHKYIKLVAAKKQKDNKNTKNRSKSDVHNAAKTATLKPLKSESKIHQAELRMFEKLKPLQESRHYLLDSIRNLQQKQHCELLQCTARFWKSFQIFSDRQSQILSIKDNGDAAFETLKLRMASVEEEKEDDFDESIAISPSFSTIRFDDPNMITKMYSLRVAESMNDYLPLTKDKRYKNAFKLGSGAFATVYRANDLLSDERDVAIKKISIGDGDNDLYLCSTMEEAQNELKMLKALGGHQQIIELLDDYEEVTVYDDKYMNLVMEYLPETLLSRCEYYGQSGDAIPHDLIQLYSFQLCKAVNYCHIKGVAHCDIKPTNLLVDVKTHCLKLCDFGCSMKMETRYHWDHAFTFDDEDDDDYKDHDYFKLDDDDGLETKENGRYPSYIGSRYYRAPEIILHSKKYDCKIDIWSIGCVIAEMFLGMFLFEGQRSENDHLDDIMRKLGAPTAEEIDAMNPKYKHKQELLDCEEEGESWDMLFCGVEEMPQGAITMMSHMLTYSPKKRCTALEALRDKYFENLYDNEAMKELLFDWTDLEIRYAKAHGVDL